jgi:hypothetical protein
MPQALSPFMIKGLPQGSGNKVAWVPPTPDEETLQDPLVDPVDLIPSPGSLGMVAGGFGGSLTKLGHSKALIDSIESIMTKGSIKNLKDIVTKTQWKDYLKEMLSHPVLDAADKSVIKGHLKEANQAWSGLAVEPSKGLRNIWKKVEKHNVANVPNSIAVLPDKVDAITTLHELPHILRADLSSTFGKDFDAVPDMLHQGFRELNKVKQLPYELKGGLLNSSEAFSQTASHYLNNTDAFKKLPKSFQLTVSRVFDELGKIAKMSKKDVSTTEQRLHLVDNMPRFLGDHPTALIDTVAKSPTGKRVFIRPEGVTRELQP